MTSDAPWLVQRVENGRFELLDPAATVDDPAIARLWVAPTRARGEITYATGEVWQVTRPERSFRFATASGTLIAVATKPSIVRERFELDLRLLGRKLTVEPARPWRRRWRIEEPHGTVGTVERRGRARQAHELRLPRVTAEPDDLVVVMGWLVAVVCTDPPSGWRAADPNRRR